ncbi:hypothetical protein [Rubinisphaera brasiliensis]|uniref:Uncharacterized protein n=1 Tax=Rubinisphaera brasiliensis (strain ATCC 49424 / DSM 5305 / JCM 21570 / IAM 15109 / NBRC 103401 / IFAM 1448) TaxID=756272 RepID=F0SPF2_RUBBR|nr:hypothetical protein [Rubinisphaera brasiliensis]ADY57856.1 hypothetical protein Plabr_0227 [Rubinisphaera brasiliensis DSM 5305]
MSSECLHYKCLTNTQSVIQGMDLTGIADSSVRILSVPTNRKADLADADRQITYPCVLIAPYGSETIGGPEAQTDDITYPVMVALIDQANQAQTTNLARNLYWRERLIDKFQYNAFGDAIAGNNQTTVQPLAVVDPAQFIEKDLWVSGLLVNYDVVQQRRTA